MKVIGKLNLTYDDDDRIKKIRIIGHVCPIVTASTKMLNFCNYEPHTYYNRTLFFNYHNGTTTIANDDGDIISEYKVTPTINGKKIFTTYKNGKIVKEVIKETLVDNASRIRTTFYEDNSPVSIILESKDFKDNKIYYTKMASGMKYEFAPYVIKSVEDTETNITVAESDCCGDATKIIKDKFGNELMEEFNDDTYIVNEYDSNNKKILSKEYEFGDLKHTYTYEQYPKQVKTYLDGEIIRNEVYMNSKMKTPSISFFKSFDDNNCDPYALTYSQVTLESIEEGDKILSVKFVAGNEEDNVERFLTITPYILDENKEEV